MTQFKEMQSLKSKKLYLRVYDEIREYIFRNNLQPGNKLPTEMEMCNMLGVSRNVLREAIKSLEITGVVQSKPGVGILIRECNMDFFMSTLISNLSLYGSAHIEENVEELRKILEIGFMDTAFDSITDGDIQTLASLTDSMRKSYNSQRRAVSEPIIGAAFAQADASFHHTIFCHIDNKLMGSILDFFWAYDKQYKLKSTHQHLDITLDKHIRIFEALKSRDRDAFHKAMYYHFNYDYNKK